MSIYRYVRFNLVPDWKMPVDAPEQIAPISACRHLWMTKEKQSAACTGKEKEKNRHREKDGDLQSKLGRSTSCIWKVFVSFKLFFFSPSSHHFFFAKFFFFFFFSFTKRRFLTSAFRYSRAVIGPFASPFKRNREWVFSLAKMLTGRFDWTGYFTC